MAKIMGEGQGLNQIFVQLQPASDATADLGNFQGMSQTGPVVIAFMIDKNLGFVLQAPESGTMDNSVTITFIGRTIIFVKLLIFPTMRGCTQRGIFCQVLSLHCTLHN